MPKKEKKFDLSFGKLVALEGWYGDPPKQFPISQTHKRYLASCFRFSSIKGKNSSETIKNICFFQNWLDTRPKMEMHERNVFPIILGGVFNFAPTFGSLCIIWWIEGTQQSSFYRNIFFSSYFFYKFVFGWFLSAMPGNHSETLFISQNYW